MASTLKSTKILRVEPGCSTDVCDHIESSLSTGKILFVSGPHTYNLYGKQVAQSLEAISKVKVEIVESNTIAYAMGLAERAIATDVDLIVGMGGGKVIDVAKFAASVSSRRFVSIPTTMANDGLASPVAVLKRNDGFPKSLGAKMPEYTFVDIDIIEKAPMIHIKAGIGDTISNYTALMDWRLAEERQEDEVDDYAFLMSRNAVDSLLMTDAREITPEFIGQLANSLVLSGIAMDFAGTSRPVSGAEHCFSHALDYYAKANNLHGIQTALGTVAVLHLREADASEVISYLSRFEICINPRALGITEEEFVHCMQHASGMRPGRYTCLDEIELSTDKLKNLYAKLVKEL